MALRAARALVAAGEGEAGQVVIEVRHAAECRRSVAAVARFAEAAFMDVAVAGTAGARGAFELLVLVALAALGGPVRAGQGEAGARVIEIRRVLHRPATGRV